ncbi:hypothetical protein EYF80_011617 [Liparis tanakae]|uniref:Uncharacterized protein n=1 Tax=Liparis tanakae TaxID=230148 RepID=A0A4Z2ILN7_9TELE|nr:hypothetical protein EYF80_011617 [Liparis tanakae]
MIASDSTDLFVLTRARPRVCSACAQVTHRSTPEREGEREGGGVPTSDGNGNGVSGLLRPAELEKQEASHYRRVCGSQCVTWESHQSTKGRLHRGGRRRSCAEGSYTCGHVN